MASYSLMKNGKEILNSKKDVQYNALNGFVYRVFEYFSRPEIGLGNATESIMKLYDKPGINEKIGNSKRYSLEFDGTILAGMFFEGTAEEVNEYNKRHQSKNPNRKRYRDEATLKINNKELYISNEWNKIDKNVLTFDKFQELIKNYYPPYSVEKVVEDPEEDGKKGEEVVDNKAIHDQFNGIFPMQKIYYGAPGTGKSYGIKEHVGVDGNGKMRTDNNIRVTFHPDSDYASFVGCYKPTMNDNDQIVYKFVPQAFAKAYVKAWKNYLAGNGENFYLVIEEINRGNCAQIFGDIFQLLDRNKYGFSEYGIVVDADLEKYLKDEFKEYLKDEIENDSLVNYLQGVFEKYIEENKDKDDDLANYLQEVLDWYSSKENIGSDSFDIKMYLPPTLSLLATMNTSDQSLFPMDSAFKRRWDWKYVPIKDEGKGWKIEGVNLSWGGFLDKINTKIEEITDSTDKQMGYYFVKPDKDDNTISIELFVDKVMFYLWNDVFKRYGNNEKNKEYNKEYNIVKFYKKDGFFDLSKVNEVLRKLLGESESKETENATE